MSAIDRFDCITSLELCEVDFKNEAINLVGDLKIILRTVAFHVFLITLHAIKNAQLIIILNEVHLTKTLITLVLDFLYCSLNSTLSK